VAVGRSTGRIKVEDMGFGACRSLRPVPYGEVHKELRERLEPLHLE